MTLREALLQSVEDLPTEAVPTPEWESIGYDKVTVRGLTAHDREEYEQSLVEIGEDGKARARERMPNVRASLIVRCVVDDSGERAFQDDDVEMLGNRSGLVIDRIWDACRRMCGMGDEAEKKAATDFPVALAASNSSG